MYLLPRCGAVSRYSLIAAQQETSENRCRAAAQTHSTTTTTTRFLLGVLHLTETGRGDRFLAEGVLAACTNLCEVGLDGGVVGGGGTALEARKEGSQALWRVGVLG